MDAKIYLGGVALGFIGFGLGKCFSENEHYCDYLDKPA